MFSKACEYGIKASLYIGHSSSKGQRVSLKEIAKSINSPEAFTAKILQKLSKNKIIKSNKGPNGGFEISKDDLKKISIRSIVTAIDGDQIFTGCALGMEECNAKMPCPLHEKFKFIRDNLDMVLRKTTLYDLSNGLNNGLTFLK